MKERLLIALRDFVAFNPHYDLKKPIKVKKGSIIIVDGGMPKDCLISNDNAMSLFSSDTEDGFKDILNICTANNIKLHPCIPQRIPKFIPLFLVNPTHNVSIPAKNRVNANNNSG